MDIKELKKSINCLKKKADKFFKSASNICDEEIIDSWEIRDEGAGGYWNVLPQKSKKLSQKAQEQSLYLASLIIPALKSSPILSESDERDIGICVKQMRAALRLRIFKSWNTEVLHDEGEVLGVMPPGQSENDASSPLNASKTFYQCIAQIEDIIQLLRITPSNIPNGLPSKNPNLPQSYRPNTAFIMMSINPDNPELDDVYDAYKNCFSKFGIEAIRADEIEHDDIITTKIIEQIKTSEFLIGDLTYERPSVYYEIGYAHSLGRRVIMYRKKETSIHFDLAAYNCPEYKNIKELKAKLLTRLEEVTNRKSTNG